ncbi:MAG: polyprenyl synthetase family protein [Verrucomicrobia bacterium]|nr:polyprenyl synthetase family protein [Verrucomicrobiota bacterium]
MLATEHSAHAVSHSPRLISATPLTWRQIADSTEPFLDAVRRELAAQIKEFDGGIAGYAEYALANQGKQLRPTLVALSAQAAGTMTDAHVLVAVIIEMVHLATLVHDDVIDEADMRRRQPTLAAHCGNEISVLLGDCLFAQALTLAATFPTSDICRAVAGATKTVCTGEILQTRLEKDFELTRADYFKVLRMKTGELFALSCELGAQLGGAQAAQQRALRHYGMALGTAYQIFDDCLDLFGTETAAGKSLGTDLAKGKLTLPMLILMDRLPPTQRARVQGFVRHWDAAYLPQVMALHREQRTLEASRHCMERYLAEALQTLDAVPPGESRSALAELTGYLAQQTDMLGQSPA